MNFSPTVTTYLCNMFDLVQCVTVDAGRPWSVQWLTIWKRLWSVCCWHCSTPMKPRVLTLCSSSMSSFLLLLFC